VVNRYLRRAHGSVAPCAPPSGTCRSRSYRSNQPSKSTIVVTFTAIYSGILGMRIGSVLVAGAGR